MTTWLLGGTSIYASSIYFYATKNNINIRPFCSKFAKWSICESWERIDLETKPDIGTLLNSDPPSLLIYGAGFCNVAECQANPDYAHTRNVESLEYLLGFLSPKTRLVYLSSDHVFGGDLGPYHEDSTPHPISVYGRSKLAAEELVRAARPDAIVIRTGLVIGPSVSGRHGHLDWLRYRANHNLPMTIISGEFRSAVPGEHYAKSIFELVKANAHGVQHIVASKPIERPLLAHRLLTSHNINATLSTRHRATLDTPHLSHVGLSSLTPSNVYDVE